MVFRQWSFNFLRQPEVTKLVLPKVLQNFEKTPNCTCWPKKLNQKGFLRNTKYKTRQKGPPSVFWDCDFSGKKIPQRIPLQFFWSFATGGMLKNPKGDFLEFCDRKDVEKSQRAPFQFFRRYETFFKNFFWVLLKRIL